jgi:hypothetical protein
VQQKGRVKLLLPSLEISYSDLVLFEPVWGLRLEFSKSQGCTESLLLATNDRILVSAVLATCGGMIVSIEPKRNEGKYLLTERQFWILTAVLAVVIVLVTRKLLAS